MYSRSIDGSTPDSFVIATNSAGIYTAQAQKKAGDSSTLRVTIVCPREGLRSNETTAPYGIAMVTCR